MRCNITGTAAQPATKMEIFLRTADSERTLKIMGVKMYNKILRYSLSTVILTLTPQLKVGSWWFSTDSDKSLNMLSTIFLTNHLCYSYLFAKGIEILKQISVVV